MRVSLSSYITRWDFMSSDSIGIDEINTDMNATLNPLELGLSAR